MRATAAFGVSGVGSALASLVLARLLSTTEFALVALAIALIQIGIHLGPLGVEGVALRRKLAPDPKLLLRTLITSAAVGSGIAAVGGLFYGLGINLVALVLLCTIAGGATMVAGALYQSKHQYGVSLALSQNQNAVLLAAAGLVALSGGRQAWLPCAVFTLGYCVSAGIGWAGLFASHSREPDLGDPIAWDEALAIAGASTATLILLQLERLLVPRILSLHDLATFGILAALAGSPYRMLQLGVGYTLVPRLRSAATASQRVSLMLKEGALVALVTLGTSAFVWLATPWIVRWFLAGKYELGRALLIATILTGTVKLAGSFAAAAVTALGTGRDLGRLNLVSWLSIGVAVAAGAYGGRWGLTGVIYGVGVGWFCRGVVSAALAFSYFETPRQARRVPEGRRES